MEHCSTPGLKNTFWGLGSSVFLKIHGTTQSRGCLLTKVCSWSSSLFRGSLESCAGWFHRLGTLLNKYRLLVITQHKYSAELVYLYLSAAVLMFPTTPRSSLSSVPMVWKCSITLSHKPQKHLSVFFFNALKASQGHAGVKGFLQIYSKREENCFGTNKKCSKTSTLSCSSEAENVPRFISSTFLPFLPRRPTSQSTCSRRTSTFWCCRQVLRGSICRESKMPFREGKLGPFSINAERVLHGREAWISGSGWAEKWRNVWPTYTPL